MPLSLRHYLICFALSLLAACGALAPEKPEVSITTVHAESGGLSLSPVVHVSLEMSILNPNSFGLPLSKVDWNLRVGTANAVPGSIDLAETIPARASAPVTARFDIGAVQAIAVAQQIASGARDYSLQGRFYFQGKLGEISVDVAHTGVID